MKKIAILSLMTFCFFLSCVHDKKQIQSMDGKSKVEFADSIHDFGQFGGTGDELVKTYDFWFTNTGDSALVINRVEPSCHCLTVEYTRNRVAHGEKGFVRLIYDGAENKKTTHFYRTAVVYSNASNSPVTLVVEGEVVIPKE